MTDKAENKNCQQTANDPTQQFTAYILTKTALQSAIRVLKNEFLQGEHSQINSSFCFFFMVLFLRLERHSHNNFTIYY